jgi:heptosyltransferase-2
MNILIILPNWLGDAVMATPAIEMLCEAYPDAELTLVGSFVSIEALKHHPRCTRHYVDDTKKSGNRFVNTYHFAKKLGQHDLAITFRNQLHSSLLVYLTGTIVTAARRSWHSMITMQSTPRLPRDIHLVEQYARLANTLIDTNSLVPGPLKLYIESEHFERPILGINPGATYGSAKRWYPEKFAAVAAAFADRYDIIIFGGPSETEMAEAIEADLQERDIANYTNLAGQTTIEQLCANIGGLDLFITNDSGPMHVAAAYQVPTVSIFGPTRHFETCQWHNEKSIIIRHDMDCSPCMKRECPLKHHECMKSITAQEVIDAVRQISVS